MVLLFIISNLIISYSSIVKLIKTFLLKLKISKWEEVSSKRSFHYTIVRSHATILGIQTTFFHNKIISIHIKRKLRFERILYENRHVSSENISSHYEGK